MSAFTPLITTSQRKRGLWTRGNTCYNSDKGLGDSVTSQIPFTHASSHHLSYTHRPLFASEFVCNGSRRKRVSRQINLCALFVWPPPPRTKKGSYSAPPIALVVFRVACTAPACASRLSSTAAAHCSCLVTPDSPCITPRSPCTAPACAFRLSPTVAAWSHLTHPVSPLAHPVPLQRAPSGCRPLQLPTVALPLVSAFSVLCAVAIH